MILLGSTGSIGRTTLEVIRGTSISIETLACGRNVRLFAEQIREFSPKIIYLRDEKDLIKIDKKLLENVEVFSGENGLEEAIKASKSTILLNAIIGFSGLKSSILALKLQKKLLLANKESLVLAGGILDTSAIIPIDSEHYGLKLIRDNFSTARIHSLVLTASGGALRDVMDASEVSLEAVLRHPNWSMGDKITIDSATMANKLYEILEAYHLFKSNMTDPKNIDAIIEKSSQVHAMVNFDDGNTIMQASVPSMAQVIANALGVEKKFQNLRLENLQNISFMPIDRAKYPIFSLKDLLLEKPSLGVVFNAANESLVDAFLSREIEFRSIAKITLKIVEQYHAIPQTLALDEIINLHGEVVLKTKAEAKNAK